VSNTAIQAGQPSAYASVLAEAQAITKSMGGSPTAAAPATYANPTDQVGTATTGRANPNVAFTTPESPDPTSAANAAGGTVAVGAAQQPTLDTAEYLDANTVNAKGLPRLAHNDGTPYLGFDIYVDTSNPEAPTFQDAQGNVIPTADVDAAIQGALATANAPSPFDFNRLNANGFPLALDATGQPLKIKGVDLYVDPQAPEDKAVFQDKEGHTMDTGAVIGELSKEQTKSLPLLQRVLTNPKTQEVGMSALNLYFNRSWYRSTQVGATQQLKMLKAASSQFQAGTSIAGKLKNVRFVKHVVNRAEVKRQAKIVSVERNVKMMDMTAAQERKFILQNKVKDLQTASTRFKTGKSLQGKLKNTPVIGKMATAMENRRQTQIRTTKAAIRTPEGSPGLWRQTKNKLRGNGASLMMGGLGAWNTYGEVKTTIRRWDDPTNQRKWDDAMRITGGTLQTGAALSALRRANVKGAFVVMTAGTLMDLGGRIAGD
jgi:hypothetical protein